jgi:cytochrome c oxidase subunit 2
VMIKMRSKDVIHSFYLPNFRTKQDAVPGQITKLWFQATQTGSYEIGCAQHCGVSHYKMRGLLVVEPEEAYRAWLGRAETDSRLRFDPANPATADGWDWEGGR